MLDISQEMGAYFILTLLFCYLVKILFTSRYPSVYCTKNEDISHIIRGCESFALPYEPTFWCCLGRPMTLFSTVLREYFAQEFPYKRESLPGADGGTVTIDWAADDSLTADSGTPIVITLSGITNGSQAPYVVDIVRQFRANNWAAAAYVYRGMGDTSLKTPVSYYASYTSDLSQIVHHIRAKYPKSPIAVVGISMGGMITFNTMVRCEAVAREVCAAVVISMPWNPFVSCEQLYQGIDYWIFNRAIAVHLKEFAYRHWDTLHKLGLVAAEIDEVTRIKEFDRAVVIKMAGYQSVEEYYTDAGPAFHVASVKAPTLAINANDDSFSYPAGIPTEEELSRLKSPLAILRYNFGGHVGFATNLTASDFFISKVAYDFAQQARFHRYSS